MNYPLCACGCGQQITRKPRPDRPNKFVHGHHRKGIVMSEDQKRKIGNSNSRPMTIKQRKLLSKIKKDGFATGKYTSYWKGKVNKGMVEGRKRWAESYIPKSLEDRKNEGRVKIAKGYLLIYDISRKKYILEHRLVMEKYLKRQLTRQEDVHHIDGDKANNSIDNLMLFPTRSAHIKFHVIHGYPSKL